MQGVLPYVLAYGGYVAALHAVPGPWHTWKRGYELRAVDPWTGQHLIWGAVAQRFGLTPGQLMILGVLNEVGELLVRRYRPQWLWGQPDVPMNLVVDLAANLAGWYAAEWLGGKR